MKSFNKNFAINCINQSQHHQENDTIEKYPFEIKHWNNCSHL